MKTKLILVILLLGIMGLLFGSEDPAEMDEMQRRTKELKALSERFKAEKDFDGVIETNTEVMKLSHFRGSFKDIDMSAVRDSIAFRQVCNKIINKLLPYIGAKENQLDAEKISISSTNMRTQYQQRVNGYPIEGVGRLVLSYEKDYNRISILNVTVDIGDKPAVVNVPLEKAIEIAHEELGLEADEAPYRPRIAYSCNPSLSVREFTLCYILTFRKHTAYVGAESGTVLFTKTNKVVRSTNVSVVGEVYDKVYTNTNQMTMHLAPLLSAFVESPVDSAHTSSDGNALLSDDSFTWMKASLSNYNLFSVKKHPNTSIVMQQAELDNLNHVIATFNDDQFHSANAFYHAVDQQAFFASMGIDNETYTAPFELAIITGYPDLQGGNYTTSNNMIEIGLDYGKLSHVVRHELSHANVYEVLQGHLFYDIEDYDKEAMDESMAVYLQCAGINSPICIYGIPNSIERIDTINTISTVLQQPINEEKYSMFEARHTIASAWWTLRSNPIFGSPDPITQVKAFDKALVEVLADDVDEDLPYRYKPRYFYNLLMTKYATDNQTWTLNEKQIAIKDAYNSRGLNFYPKVESISDNGVAKNIFGLNDPVHVKLSNCPQNTAISIYMVKHNDYSYVDGVAITTLEAAYPNNFNPITGETTNPQGEWSGFLWACREEGEYDIIVDIGSPNTPDGIIRFSFSGADVMDGFDGRTAPGLTVVDKNIEITMAIDISNSLDNARVHSLKTARILVSSLFHGDRINVFGFGLDDSVPTSPWDYIVNMIGTANGGVEVSNNISALCNSVRMPLNFETEYPNGLDTNLIAPFTNGHQRFNSLYDDKGFVLLSDGWQCTQPNNAITPVNPSVAIQNLINNEYVPDDIGCFALRYEITPPTNNNTLHIPYDNITTGALMSNIAQWGNGAVYLQSNVLSSFFDIDNVLNDIRNTPSTEHRTGNITTGSDVIIPFLVDNNAGRLCVQIASGHQEFSPFIISILSPSGVQYGTGSEGYQTYYSLGRIDVEKPESGLWTATISSTLPNQQYSFTAKVDSDVCMEISAIPKSQSIDKPMFVSVILKDYNTPLCGAVVTATFIRDEWKYKQFLYDDGHHNDGVANDGLYGNYLYIYNSALEQFGDPEGLYKVTLSANTPTHNAQRVRTYTVNMLAPTIVLTNRRILQEGWNWVGFPRLVREGNGQDIDYATVSLSPYLESIKGIGGDAFFRDNGWIYQGLETLNSIDGYKLNVAGIDEVRLYEQGSITDTTMVYNLSPLDWNWITYPCYRLSTPQSALVGVLDDIDYVMAQDWSMFKRNGIWHSDPYSRTPILRYGDSILIRAERQTSFYWNSSEAPPEDIKPIKTSILTYKEKADYETLMVEGIEGSPEYDEIGVFQDGICVGARVAEGYPLQILAYTEAAKADSTKLEIRIVSETKGTTCLTPTYIQDFSSMSIGTSLFPSPGSFRSVNLKAGDQVVPPTFSMSRNYPNPFNPSTTINYGIPSSGVVKLNIFNIRGQKVKSLLNILCVPGYHQVVWDGTDDNNRGVASGIYFSRMEYNGKSHIQKMMLMK